MPSAAARHVLARLRRAIGGADRTSAGWTRRATEPATTVPLTVRATSADDADVRLLLDVHVHRLPDAQPRLEQATHALVVPAGERWVREHLLADLRGTRTVRADLEDVVRDELAGLGVSLVRLDVVAVEHLLISPSAEASRRRHEGGGPP